MTQTFPPDPHHLRKEADRLITFFARTSVDPTGGFHALDARGHPISGAPHELFSTCRMIHCFAAAELLGHETARQITSHGLQALTDIFHDPVHGGFVWAPDANTGFMTDKVAYGHAFVLLAAASAKTAGHHAAQAIYEDVRHVLLQRFWDEENGAMREEFRADWSLFSGYRGQNANMHMVEALMAAYEVWGERRWLTMAERIADLIINRHARNAGWVVIEHFDAAWVPQPEFSGDPMFRPAGTTPGHALEWARLCVQLWLLGQKRLDWLLEAAQSLFRNAAQMAWAEDGGFVYTLKMDGSVDIPDRFWWPSCEGLAAASSLFKVTDDPYYADWFERIWHVLEHEFIDHDAGGWWPEAGQRSTVFEGKPDIYHALQACLLPLLPPDQSLVPALKARL